MDTQVIAGAEAQMIPLRFIHRRHGPAVAVLLPYLTGLYLYEDNIFLVFANDVKLAVRSKKIASLYPPAVFLKVFYGRLLAEISRLLSGTKELHLLRNLRKVFLCSGQGPCSLTKSICSLVG